MNAKNAEKFRAIMETETVMNLELLLAGGESLGASETSLRIIREVLAEKKAEIERIFS